MLASFSDEWLQLNHPYMGRHRRAVLYQEVEIENNSSPLPLRRW
jgi:hypothetical protein